MELAGVLETVLYCTNENEGEARRFYRAVLGLRSFSDDSSGFRLGRSVFLLDPAGNVVEIAEGDLWPA